MGRAGEENVGGWSRLMDEKTVGERGDGGILSDLDGVNGFDGGAGWIGEGREKLAAFGDRYELSYAVGGGAAG